MMEFTLAMLAELVVSIGLGLELYFKGLGDKVSIQNHTLDDFKFLHGVLFVFYLAAFILATVQRVQVRSEDPETKLIDETNRAEGVDSHSLSSNTEDYGSSGEDWGRLLSASSLEVHVTEARAIWDVYDLPMTLTAASYFLRFFLSGLRLLWRDSMGDVRSWYVPPNIDYLIHRYGEFVMLMIGEGVLSLLIIETVETKDYYTAVIFGMLTMIFIHVLKSESEPTDSSKHAL